MSLQQPLAQSQAAELPKSPYRGLSPFGDSDLDALFFFGRERESEVITANLIASRLTVLYGPTGVGKSSVLRAGVAQRLRVIAEQDAAEGQPGLAVVLFASWGEELVPALLDATTAGLARAPGAPSSDVPAGGSLADGLAAASAALGGSLYVILDQTEEYFLYHGQDGGPDRFAAEFAEAVGRPDLRVNFLISIRDDALAQLDLFKRRVPGILSNYLRLDRLDRRAAEAAVVRPLERWNELTGERVQIEPGLLPALLDGVVAGRVDLGEAARGGLEDQTAAGLIEAPFLQLVLERLWDVERAAGSSTLRLATFQDLGGAETIVRTHLEGAMANLTDGQRDLAASVFNHLVTPSGTKIAHSSADLANYAEVEQAELLPVLKALGHERILRSVESDGDTDGSRFEIFHDVLAEPVLAWRATHRAQRDRRASERRHRRLVVFAAVALAVAAAMAAVTVYALSQRSEARDQARRARAGELAATAVALNGTDPTRALRTAALAARLQPSGRTEEVLRDALVAARLRAILPTGRVGPVTAAFSPDNSLVVVAGGPGGARLFGTRTGALLRTFDASRSVQATAFSRDGRRLATGDTRGDARLWNVRSGRLLARLPHDGGVNDVSFSRDGSTVVTASSDSTARLWSTDSGKLLLVLRNNGPVARAALSPDGRRVVTVSGSSSKTEGAYLFDAATGRLLANLPQQGITSARFSRNGKLLATTSLDRSARIWDGRTGTPLRTLPQPEGHVLASEFSPDGKLLVTASDSAAAGVWDVGTGTRLLLLVGATNAVETSSFSPDGRYVVVSSLDRAARIYASRDGFPKSILLGHTEGVTSAAFSRDGSSVVTASEDGTARLWDPGTRDPLRLLGSHHGAVNVASFGRDGRLALSASDDGTAKIWRVSDHRLLRTLAEPGSVEDASFSPDGRLVASAGADGRARLWQVDTGRPLHVLRGHRGGVNNVTFSRDGRLLVSGGDDGTARLWQVATGRLLHVLHGHGGPLLRASFSPDGRLVATAGDDGTTRIWQVSTGRPVHVLRGHDGAVLRASFSPDGRLVLTAGDDGTARLWSARTGASVHTLTGHTGAVRDAEFSADGRLVVTASDDHDARIWSAATGKLLRLLRGHFNAVQSASFSRDGHWVVTGGPFTAGLWRTSTGRLFSITGLNNDPFLRGHTMPLTSATFSPDGRRILTSSLDGTVRVFTCDVCGGLRDLLTLADVRLAKIAGALTPAERRRYLGT